MWQRAGGLRASPEGGQGGSSLDQTVAAGLERSPANPCRDESYHPRHPVGGCGGNNGEQVMTLTRAALLLAILIVCPFPAVGSDLAKIDRNIKKEPACPTPDEKLLQAAGIGRTGADLLEFFRKRTVTDQDRRRIADHLQQLGAARFRQREEATRDLLALGKIYPGTVVPLLRRATRDPDLEIAKRAGVCLQILEEEGDGALVAAAVRVLAGLKPLGTVQVLLAYLPNAGDETLEEDIANALAVVGVEEGKPGPGLWAAARAPPPLRRLAAAAALARANGQVHRATAYKLLKDTDARVRLWTAQALLAVQDKTAVPALIALLSEGPLATAHSAQGLLWDLAGDQAPQTSLGEGPSARRQCQRAWQAWWKDHQGEVDLAKINWTERKLGLTLVCECWINGQTIGAVRAFGPDGKVHWQIEGIRNTSDVQVLPGRRVLLAETEEKKV